MNPIRGPFGLKAEDLLRAALRAGQRPERDELRKLHRASRGKLSDDLRGHYYEDGPNGKPGRPKGPARLHSSRALFRLVAISIYRLYADVLAGRIPTKVLTYQILPLSVLPYLKDDDDDDGVYSAVRQRFGVPDDDSPIEGASEKALAVSAKDMSGEEEGDFFISPGGLGRWITQFNVAHNWADRAILLP